MPLGFSLVELVITLLIMGVLAAIAAPHFSSAAARQRARVAADRVVADLKLARQRAEAASSDYQVTFNPDGDYYKLGTTGSDAQSVELSDEPYQCEIDTASFGGSSSVTFNAFGVASNAGSVQVSGGGTSYTVSVSEAGEVSVQ